MGGFFNFLKHTIKPQLEDCSLYAFIKHFIQTSSCKALNKLFFPSDGHNANCMRYEYMHINETGTIHLAVVENLYVREESGVEETPLKSCTFGLL